MAVLLRVQVFWDAMCVSRELLTDVPNEHGVAGPFIVR